MRVRQGIVCKTNLPATTSMRAPGVTQGVFAIEAILDNAAQTLGMDVDTLRTANFLQIVRRHSDDQRWSKTPAVSP